MNWYFHVAWIATLLTGLSNGRNLASGFGIPSGRVSQNSMVANSDGANTPANRFSDDEEKLTVKRTLKLAHKSTLLKSATDCAACTQSAQIEPLLLGMALHTIRFSVGHGLRLDQRH